MLFKTIVPILFIHRCAKSIWPRTIGVDHRHDLITPNIFKAPIPLLDTY